MFGNRGFTLIEVVIAIVIIAIAFGVLFDMLYKAKKDMEYSIGIFNKTTELDRKLKLRDFENIKVSENPLSDYPQVIEKEYRLDNVYFIQYEIKK